jgi:hypothetical protein
MTTQDIVAELLNRCEVLRDEDVTYQLAMKRDQEWRG